jgi:hypothetical protein
MEAKQRYLNDIEKAKVVTKLNDILLPHFENGMYFLITPRFIDNFVVRGYDHLNKEFILTPVTARYIKTTSRRFWEYVVGVSPLTFDLNVLDNLFEHFKNDTLSTWRK